MILPHAVKVQNCTSVEFAHRRLQHYSNLQQTEDLPQCRSCQQVLRKTAAA